MANNNVAARSEATGYEDSGPVDCSGSFDTSSCKGRTAIVTGGASGIGAAYVRALAKAGAYVVIADINESAAQKIQQEFPDTTAAIKCDVLSWKDQLAAFKKAIELSPDDSIDCVVANAGISTDDAILTNDISKDEPDEPSFPVLDININGVFYTTKLAMWYLQKQNAGDQKKDRCLVLQASLAGYLDLVAPSYGASKFAVRGLMRALRRTSGKDGIRVNLIAPWYINTPILSSQMSTLIEGSGAEFAEVEDAALGMMHMVSDGSIHGRAFGIVPRTWKGAPNGYVDLDQDDFKEGTWMHEKQQNVFKPFKLAAEKSQAK
ncbi:uncharacterized protein LTR77_002475 [Saxophila tyrrhenica]|uniref:5'-hydroxyaverantin dehydrogenase n=1 Tax=Saxophila tyrrhenica TaxID=1690608 RepID=A0AAV9PJB7_9PEZI|nr:hypothetical protein LTR77_002475 [Saxophila tyrrhenica]